MPWKFFLRFNFHLDSLIVDGMIWEVREGAKFWKVESKKEIG
jgi:hypothetical protein